MKILALDQASITTGYAIFEDKKLINYGAISLHQKDLGIRLLALKEQVAKLIKDNQIDLLIIEDIQLQNNVGNNVRTFKVLAEVFGVLEVLAAELKIKLAIISSQTWKSALKISGRTRDEQKKSAMNYVVSTYNISGVQDTFDAICIGDCYVRTIMNN